MKFAVIDVETANERRESICQIGIVIATKDFIIKKWSALINPEMEFASFNCRLHGISEAHTQYAPTFPEIYADVIKLVSGCAVYQYSSFDEQAVNSACERYGLDVPKVQWIDAIQLVRNTWSEIFSSKYSLPDVCSRLGIEYKSHDALEDASATALVIQRALREPKREARALDKITSSIHRGSKLNYTSDDGVSAIKSISDHSLHGKVFLFSKVEPKVELKLKVMRLGAHTKDNFSKKITHLVTTDEIINGKQPPTEKYLKVKQAKESGAQIEILSLEEFNLIIDALTLQNSITT